MLLSRIYKISRIDFKYVHMEALQLLYCQKVCVKILKVKLETLQRIIRNIEGITETIRKRRLQFFGHIYRTDESRLTKRIFM
ncbi:uncharacterized protein LOC118444358 isoform X2 [Vespa mandarinia]|uniref:uncharacterized protein LOC118444358 isoform X2 n=1 Tax=Vespa mandarinia TaxID=7446 RepID=UPI00161D2846|nr:uncharacterized protein LOC118444358 isoform X2 [Vespa mandarinia]